MNRYIFPAVLCLSLPLMGLSQIVNGDFEYDPFGAPAISGWSGGNILGQPIGAPLFPPFNTPAPPIGVSGNCSAGIPSGTTLRQSFVGEQGLGYSVTFSAKSMALAVAGTLRVRVARSDGTVLAQSEPILQSGGAGSAGYTAFSLTVPSLAVSGPLVLEFANTRSAAHDSSVSVDAVQLTATAPSAPPALSAKFLGGPASSSIHLEWNEPAFGYGLQRASSLDGVWTDLQDVRLQRQEGRFTTDISITGTRPEYYRLKTVP
jgi:hypothetical protein